MKKLARIQCLVHQPHAYTFTFEPLYRFLYWQAAKRLGKKSLLFKLPTGLKMKLTSQMAGASSFYYYGLPDYEEQKFLLNWLQPEDLFVDVGANVGGWSFLAAGAGANVIAVEPITESYNRFNENIKLNNCENKICLLKMGIGNTDGSLRFTTDQDTGNKVIDDTYDGATETVAVKKLDNVLKNVQPSIIKIDVEDHELSVIQGACETLSKNSLKALIIETYRWANYKKKNLIEMEQTLQENEFFPVKYDYNKNEIIRLTKPSEGGQNTIYIKRRFLN